MHGLKKLKEMIFSVLNLREKKQTFMKVGESRLFSSL